jgi:tRNA/rRNA methyltransferase
MSEFPTSALPSVDLLTRIRIVLVRTSHPGNIGAAARAMHTMGLRRLTLVAPKHLPDRDDAIALAAHGAHILEAAQTVASLDDALAGAALTIGMSARPREFVGRVTNVRRAAQEAMKHCEHGDVAFVFGTEMSGLTNDELARCAIAATIPANPAYPSLNLAAAVQVAAYELRVAAAGDVVWSAPEHPRASYDEIESLYTHAQRTLTAMAFLKPAMPKRLLPRLRRLFARAALEREELNILRGILARVDDLLARAARANDDERDR